jgi:hypothetical protein
MTNQNAKRASKLEFIRFTCFLAVAFPAMKNTTETIIIFQDEYTVLVQEECSLLLHGGHCLLIQEHKFLVSQTGNLRIVQEERVSSCTRIHDYVLLVQNNNSRITQEPYILINVVCCTNTAFVCTRCYSCTRKYVSCADKHILLVPTTIVLLVNRQIRPLAQEEHFP